jgi:hypothetical protein
MRNAFTCIVISFFIFACQQQEKDINADEDIQTADFIFAFPEKQLPIQFNTIDINQKESDSFYIKSSVVSKFIPDSVFKSDFKQLKKVKFYRKARFKAEETKETYLFLSAEEKNNKKIYLICYNDKDEFTAAMKLMEKTNKAGLTMEGGIDKRLTIIKKYYELLERDIEILANTLTEEVGKPLQQARNEVNGSRSRIAWMLDNAELLCSFEGWVVHHCFVQGDLVVVDDPTLVSSMVSFSVSNLSFAYHN